MDRIRIDPLTIIALKAGVYDRQKVIDNLIGRVVTGEDQLFAYDGAVFTVEMNTLEHYVHMYSYGVGTRGIKIIRQFMRDLWDRVPFDVVLAPIEDAQIARLARILGWTFSVKASTGHEIYYLRRSQ